MSSPSISQSISFFPLPFLFLHLYMHTKINKDLIPENDNVATQGFVSKRKQKPKKKTTENNNVGRI